MSIGSSLEKDTIEQQLLPFNILSFMSENDNNVNSNISPEEEKFFIVGIGASAGGLRALEEFFVHLLTDSGAAFVVI